MSLVKVLPFNLSYHQFSVHSLLSAGYFGVIQSAQMGEEMVPNIQKNWTRHIQLC